MAAPRTMTPPTGNFLPVDRPPGQAVNKTPPGSADNGRNDCQIGSNPSIYKKHWVFLSSAADSNSAAFCLMLQCGVLISCTDPLGQWGSAWNQIGNLCEAATHRLRIKITLLKRWFIWPSWDQPSSMLLLRHPYWYH